MGVENLRSGIEVPLVAVVNENLTGIVVSEVLMVGFRLTVVKVDVLIVNYYFGRSFSFPDSGSIVTGLNLVALKNDFDCM